MMKIPVIYASQKMSVDKTTRKMKQIVLAAICGVVLFIIFVAGLWPFNPYLPNNVTWLKAENGLHFGNHGTLFSSEPFVEQNLRSDKKTSTLEIWLRPASDNSDRTILAFYNARTVEEFTLQQYQDSFVVTTRRQDPQGRFRTTHIGIDHVFLNKQQVFVTIASGTEGTTFYLNGNPTVRSAIPVLTSKDFSGQLILGTAPADDDTWGGELLGLALYNHALSMAEVMPSYLAWFQHDRRDPRETHDAFALYLFDEGVGRLVHNHSAPGPDLMIPESFTVLHKPFLSVPWYDFKLSRSYIKDVIVNVTGFVPFGFFFYAYFNSIRSNSRYRMSIAVILLGGAISLLIEVLQFYLPTRDSSLKDVITNTLGTGLGVILYRYYPIIQ